MAGVSGGNGGSPPPGRGDALDTLLFLIERGETVSPFPRAVVAVLARAGRLLLRGGWTPRLTRVEHLRLCEALEDAIHEARQTDGWYKDLLKRAFTAYDCEDVILRYHAAVDDDLEVELVGLD